MSWPYVSPAKTISALAIICNQDGTALRELSARFLDVFPPQERFWALCSILSVLEEPDVLSQPERITALYILHEAYSSAPPGQHPFAAYLTQAVHTATTTATEQAFILQLLANVATSEVGNLSSEEAVAAVLQQPLPSVPPPAELKAAYAPARDPLPGADCARGDQDEHGTSASGKHQSREQERDNGRPNSSSLAAWSPISATHQLLAFLRPQLFQLPLLDSELQWIGPQVPLRLLWDDGGGHASQERSEGANERIGAAIVDGIASDKAELQDVLRRASEGPLLPAQQQQVLAALQDKPQLVLSCGVAAEQLPDLVEHNPMVATAVVQGALQCGSADCLLSILAAMAPSLHCMEVVNGLTASTLLPARFLHLYISNCISSCENAQDKHIQSRLVRLVCVFLQSLIRNKAVNVQDLFLEVQAFCIAFSRIREAAALFRLLKALESADGSKSDGNKAGSEVVGDDEYTSSSRAAGLQ